MRQRGIERARSLLESHRPEHLEAKTAAELERMARAFQAQAIEEGRSGSAGAE